MMVGYTLSGYLELIGLAATNLEPGGRGRNQKQALEGADRQANKLEICCSINYNGRLPYNPLPAGVVICIPLDSLLAFI